MGLIGVRFEDELQAPTSASGQRYIAYSRAGSLLEYIERCIIIAAHQHFQVLWRVDWSFDQVKPRRRTHTKFIANPAASLPQKSIKSTHYQ
jgi:hypothetical protein